MWILISGFLEVCWVILMHKLNWESFCLLPCFIPEWKILVGGVEPAKKQTYQSKTQPIQEQKQEKK